MKQAGRKAVARAKRAKEPTKYAAAPNKFAAEFELLHAAHRGRMSVAIAAAVAEKLRGVAQVIGLAGDTSIRQSNVPASVARAVAAADEMLEAQIRELEALAVEPLFGPVNVAELLERAASLIQGDTGNVKIVLAPSPKLAPVRANSLDLMEIVYALMRNACEALRASGGDIHVSTAQNAELVQIVVEDDGPGLPAVLRSQLFEPFVRPRAGESHLGIGLAVARELARRNSGELVLDPRSAVGARFVITMPRWISPRVGRGPSGR